MEDYLDQLPHLEEAIKVIVEAKQLLKVGRFKLTRLVWK